MKKLAQGLLVAGVAIALLSGCGNNNENANGAASPSPAAANEQTDAQSTASIVNQADAFVKALSADGTWIVATLNDLTVDTDVVVAGEFHDKGAAENAIYRKLALYTQDEDHNITASFNLTVPKITVQSENFKVQGGTIKGDVYVEANGFSLDKTATIDGNLYFASEDVKATAVLDGEVTGETAVQ
ncbi:polymer-forming cytoskeletal protein [Paenibacillus sp. S150]|uniref:polymer-forming cytoskeletal protein n=1 Tax=Paenibacillus sp. S150 TaxID=2749826 RepID=UPI001C57950F|nr:polymer-forming cytoskeletal protein [Paenibacillus sp. S150]MBW4083036.1 polymer-forming cytoskeletal protein [Paenibacillus sp. S150]